MTNLIPRGSFVLASASKHAKLQTGVPRFSLVMDGAENIGAAPIHMEPDTGTGIWINAMLCQVYLHSLVQM